MEGGEDKEGEEEEEECSRIEGGGERMLKSQPPHLCVFAYTLGFGPLSNPPHVGPSGS